MKLSRLQGRKVNDFLLRKGKVWRGKTFNVHWLTGAPRHPQADPSKMALYVGTIASAKLHKSAVVRNRMRRRVREAFRVAVKDLTEIPTAQLLLAPRSASLKSPFADIEKDIRLFLTTLSSWPKQKSDLPVSGISSSSSPSRISDPK